MTGHLKLLASQQARVSLRSRATPCSPGGGVPLLVQQLEQIVRQPVRHELCHDGQEVRCVIVGIAPALLTLQRLHIRRVTIPCCPAEAP